MCLVFKGPLREEGGRMEEKSGEKKEETVGLMDIKRMRWKNVDISNENG